MKQPFLFIFACMQILIIQTAFIGDVILATALIEKLKAHHPTASIDFVLRKGNEALLEAHPHLREVLVWDKKGGKWRNLYQILKKIRQTRYDLVVNVQRFASSGMLTAFSQGKTTVGFAKNPFSSLFTQRFPHTIGNGTHEVARNQQLIEAWTDALPARPRLYPAPKHYEQAEQYINEVGKPYICIAPTSVWFTKQWAEEKWIDFIKQVPEKYHIFLLGAPSDAEACERMGEGQARLTNLAGKLSLLASACLMQKAHMNYVNDSAPMHLASAMNAPTCAIFCSTVPAFGYTPLADRATVIEVGKELACRPCGLHGKKACPEKHFRCALDIETEALLALL
ncbi:MAG: glycosyltransferase family 9 protein [Bacteroidetes bacterium]|nr:MAG: glycosyltransferase family 9 protein [Bacteroidota bacterium]